MELRHMKYFLTVCEEMNFTRAAEKLNIAQPPLSRQIKDLEEELGTELFIRNPHKLELTQAGVLFRQYATQILELADKSVEEVKEVNTGLKGTLYLASVEGHAPRLFSKWIAGFSEKYPDVEYHLWNGNSDEVIDRVNKGLCDLAVIMEPHNPEGLNSMPVYKEPWVCMLPPNHPLENRKKKDITFKEIAPYELIIPSRTSRTSEISGWFNESGVKPKIKCRIAHMLNAYELTKEGVGIAIYPASAGELINDNSVTIRKLKNPSVTASYVLIWNKERKLSLVAEEFLDFVKQD